MLGATVQNSDALVTGRPEFVHPYSSKINATCFIIGGTRIPKSISYFSFVISFETNDGP